MDSIRGHLNDLPMLAKTYRLSRVTWDGLEMKSIGPGPTSVWWFVSLKAV